MVLFSEFNFSLGLTLGWAVINYGINIKLFEKMQWVN